MSDRKYFLEKKKRIWTLGVFILLMSFGCVEKHKGVVNTISEIHSQKFTKSINYNKKATKFGIYYAVNHCSYSIKFQTNPPDLTKIESIPDLTVRTATYENYLRRGVDMFWQDEPELGYYCLDNSVEGRNITRTHAIQLRDAGIDFVFVDFTNNVLSPRAFNKNNANSCAKTQQSNLLKGNKVRGCIGFGSNQQEEITKKMLESFQVLVSEWSKIKNAPKIVPWVPITKYNAADFIFVRGGEVIHHFPLLIEDIYSILKGNSQTNDLQYKDILLSVHDDISNDSSPLIFNTVNQHFPEDKLEVELWKDRGFKIQNVWARFPNKVELESEVSYLKHVVGSFPQDQKPVMKDYESLLKTVIPNDLQNIFPLHQNEDIQSYFNRIALLINNLQSSDSNNKDASELLNNIKFNLNKISQQAGEFYWHSVNTDQLWYWRSPCIHPKEFKLSQGNQACNQRISNNGKVIPVSTAFEWVSFSEETTSIPQMQGKVFERYFDVLEKYSDTAEFVLIDSWNEWVTPFRRCESKKQHGEEIFFSFKNPPRLNDDTRNETAVNFLIKQGHKILPVEYWITQEKQRIDDSKISVACQFISETGSSYEWLANVNPATGASDRLRPHFHHHWVGEFRSDIEAGKHSGSQMYDIMKRRILNFKKIHP